MEPVGHSLAYAIVPPLSRSQNAVFGGNWASFRVWRTDVDEEEDAPVMGPEANDNTASESASSTHCAKLQRHREQTAHLLAALLHSLSVRAQIPTAQRDSIRGPLGAAKAPSGLARRIEHLSQV